MSDENVRSWARLDACAVYVAGLPALAALCRVLEDKHSIVQPLVELCRVKLEEMALCGDLDLSQLQRVAPYLELLPAALVCRFVHSLLVKSDSGLFPLALRSLLGRLHLVVPYAVLRRCPLPRVWPQVCRVDHWTEGSIQFAIPESTDGYFCSVCLTIACGECLPECQVCQALVCKNCAIFTQGQVPKLTEWEWEKAGKPVPLEFRSVDMWTCTGPCEPQRKFSWALQAQEEYERKTWARASEYPACVCCYRSLADSFPGTMLREEMNRLEAQLFRECQECCELACADKCVTNCEECYKPWCSHCSHEIAPCQRCTKEAVCTHCLHSLDFDQEGEALVCWSCYKETLECKKRVAGMVAWLDPESLSPAVRDRLAAGIAQHGGSVVCRPPLLPATTDASGQEGPPVTHIISAASPSPHSERSTTVKPETVLAWLACLAPPTQQLR